jgi:hypothetical protein
MLRVSPKVNSHHAIALLRDDATKTIGSETGSWLQVSNLWYVCNLMRDCARCTKLISWWISQPGHMSVRIQLELDLTHPDRNLSIRYGRCLALAQHLLLLYPGISVNVV